MSDIREYFNNKTDEELELIKELIVLYSCVEKYDENNIDPSIKDMSFLTSDKRKSDSPYDPTFICNECNKEYIGIMCQCKIDDLLTAVSTPNKNICTEDDKELDKQEEE